MWLYGYGAACLTDVKPKIGKNSAIFEWVKGKRREKGGEKEGKRRE